MLGSLVLSVECVHGMVGARAPSSLGAVMEVGVSTRRECCFGDDKSICGGGGVVVKGRFVSESVDTRE